MTYPLYIGYYFKVSPTIPGSEILMAELILAGFESFVETPKGLEAYIQKKDESPTMLDAVNILKNKSFSISYRIKEISPVNWNAQWEANFKPVTVDKRCHIRAPFHTPADIDFDIIIEPKMSFGTGHHQTTYMIIQLMLETDFKKKSVLDMGCGTAVLAILAEKMGSPCVEAIDIDEWCYQNSLENTVLNNCSNIRVLKGDKALIKTKKFDCILVNINRNTLLRDIHQYSTCLNANGFLFLSGFYKDDVPLIQEACKRSNLTQEIQISCDEWTALKFKKQ